MVNAGQDLGNSMGSKILMILQAPLGCLCNNNFHYSYTNHFALLKISSFSNQKSSSILVRNDLTNTLLAAMRRQIKIMRSWKLGYLDLDTFFCRAQYKLSFWRWVRIWKSFFDWSTQFFTVWIESFGKIMITNRHLHRCAVRYFSANHATFL